MPTMQPSPPLPPAPVDALLAPGRMLLLAAQHVLVMYTGAIAVPLVIGSTLHLSAQHVATLIQADLLTCGLATLVQTVGLGGFGARLPLMQGVSFAVISCVTGIASNPELLARGGDAGLRAVYGAVIVAGLIAMLAAPLGAYVIRLFPPVVVGTSLMIMGLSLLPVAATDIAVDASSPGNGILAATVLVVAIGLSVWGKGTIRNLAVFLGVGAGLLLAVLTGRLHPHLDAMPPAIAVIPPFPFGWPTFHLAPILGMTIVVAITWVESVGDAVIVGEMCERPATPKRVGQLLRADGLATLIGGIMGSFPYTAFSENVALLGITGVRSRWVVALAGGLLICLGLSPLLAATVAAIPPALAGGAGMFIFSSLFMVGINTVASIDLAPGRPTTLVAGLSVAMAMTVTSSPALLGFLPSWSQPVTGSPVIMGSLCAIVLNLLLVRAPKEDTVHHGLPSGSGVASRGTGNLAPLHADNPAEARA
jgi:uric acid transporter